MVTRTKKNQTDLFLEILKVQDAQRVDQPQEEQKNIETKTNQDLQGENNILKVDLQDMLKSTDLKDELRDQLHPNVPVRDLFQDLDPEALETPVITPKIDRILMIPSIKANLIVKPKISTGNLKKKPMVKSLQTKSTEKRQMQQRSHNSSKAKIKWTNPKRPWLNEIPLWNKTCD